MDSLTIRQPDDWHVHLRDGSMMHAVLPFTARQFARAIIMPNLDPPVTTRQAAAAYRGRIKAGLPEGATFTPLMTAYLTDDTAPDEIAYGFQEGIWAAAKLYPAKATTNSAFGVTDIRKIDQVLQRMQEIDMPLLIHGEVTDPGVDIFDREQVFIDRILIPLRERLPALRIVLEHVTTAEGADYVAESKSGIAATVTPHHLMLNRNALFDGGLRPHAYCLPVLKREKHRAALRRHVISGSDRFFLGTDSAPHAITAKEADCGCAGIFCAPAALAAYASVFDEMGALDRFEAFASLNGPRFYRLPVNDALVTLVRRPWDVPRSIGAGEQTIQPFLAGSSVTWDFAPQALS